MGPAASVHCRPGRSSQQVLKPTNHEMRIVKEAFKLFDKNQDGRISCEELEDVMKTLGIRTTRREIDEMMSEVDRNNSGGLENKEFALLIVPKLRDKEKREQEMRRAFKTFDLDGNGYIDQQELKAVLIEIGQYVNDEEVANLRRDADLNNDGKIDYDEFIRVIYQDIS